MAVEVTHMGIGVSIFLFAIGAVLAFAVNVDTSGLDLDMVGVILMIVGAVGLVLSLMFWNPWTRRETDAHVHEHGSHPGHTHA